MSNAIFLKLEDAEGECTDEAHDKEINIDSFNWGIANMGSMESGQGVSAGRPQAFELTVQKIIDTSSHLMIQRCASGKVFPKATISVQRAGGEKVQALTIEFKNVYVTSYSLNDARHSGQLPTESVNFAYENMQFKYTKQKEDGSADAEKEAGYDLKLNKVS